MCTIGMIPYEAANDTTFFAPMTSASAGPGLSGTASDAKWVDVIIMTMKPNSNNVHPIPSC